MELNDKEQHRTGATRDCRRQLVEMLGAAGGHAIGKFGQAGLAHEMDVLDF